MKFDSIYRHGNGEKDAISMILQAGGSRGDCAPIRQNLPFSPPLSFAIVESLGQESN
jgi:hypothetical protein